MKSPEKEESISLEKQYSLLERINNPSDLRKLSVEQLPALCAEIREYLIDNLSVNPGHFASSMGAVEIIVALHYVFDTPSDRIVFDVGHQAYAHKLLTGRREAFKTQRNFEGISGFPNPAESEYDTFTCGHAGNSISAALGMAIADKTTPGNEKRKTVALIGDASISGGLAFEGLNNASNSPNNLLIVLNDNDMSIDDNVGAMHHYLTEITTSAGYNNLRHKTSSFFRRIGILNAKTQKRIQRLNNSLKSFISRRQNIFEGLDIRYFGPYDGHDIVKLVETLNKIKNMEGPRILHIATVKGKGYAPAEANPACWHAPGKFDPATGERAADKVTPTPPLWQEIFGTTLVELADNNPLITAVTAAMPAGTSVNLMMAKHPSRSFDVGISEGHAVTFAGGLAAAGKKPFVAIYSSFLQRAFDNIIHDVAIQGLPVVFCIDRAGIVGEDGVTHHGLFDLAYLNMIPGMTIGAPSDEETLRNMLFTASQFNSPIAIRYPRGRASRTDWQTEMRTIKPGKGIVRKNPDTSEAKAAIIYLGTVGQNALKASDILEKEGIPTGVFDMVWLKPLDKELLRHILEKYPVVITVEDGSITGGLGSAVAEYIADNNLSNTLVRLGVPDKWVTHGKIDQLQHLCGYGVNDIAATVRTALAKK